MTLKPWIENGQESHEQENNLWANLSLQPKAEAITEKTAFDLKNHIDNYPDFPKPWIQFKDISPILMSEEAMSYVLEKLQAYSIHADIVALMDARWFLFRIPWKPAIMIRKKGKLPWETTDVIYQKEYDADVMEIQKTAIKPWQKVVIVDDLLATGWTMNAAATLIEKAWGEVIGLFNVVQLNDSYCVAERKKYNLDRYDINSLAHYDE